MPRALRLPGWPPAHAHAGCGRARPRIVYAAGSFVILLLRLAAASPQTLSSDRHQGHESSRRDGSSLAEINNRQSISDRRKQSDFFFFFLNKSVRKPASSPGRPLGAARAGGWVWCRQSWPGCRSGPGCTAPSRRRGEKGGPPGTRGARGHGPQGGRRARCSRDCDSPEL